MFTTSLPLDKARTSAPGDVFDQLAETCTIRRTAEIHELELIAQACDTWTVTERRADAACEKLIRGGADGTPLIGEFLALELAGILQTSPTNAALRIREVLDLRDRHPELWTAVRTGQMPPWQALKIAALCAAAGLTAEAARWVDHQLSLVLLPGLGWARLQRLVAGLITKADPALAAERAHQRHIDRYVHVGHHTDGGSELFARIDTEDALALTTTIRNLADTLAATGSNEDARQRRATALGILADPATAAALLAQGTAALSQPTEATRLEQSAHSSLLTPCNWSTAPAGDQVSARVDARPTTSTTGTTAGKHPSARRTTVFVHLSGDGEAGVARVEGVGPLDPDTLRRFLAGSHVTIRPVIDANAPPAVDSYEIPERLRTAVTLRNPIEVFPYSSRPSRALDLDHTTPYDPGAPPGSHQTRADNLGPLSRKTHRAKTARLWHVEQTEPGVFHWTSPTGHRYRVSSQGTIPLGRARPDQPRSRGGRERADHSRS